MTAVATGQPKQCEVPDPLVLGVLGPVTALSGPKLEPLTVHRKALALEMVVYLALHGTVPNASLDDGLFAGANLNARKYRIQATAAARRWLGHGRLPRTDGQLHLQGVMTDWDEYRSLAASGRMGEALRLVRGQPFAGLRTSSGWVEPWQATIIETIHHDGLEYARKRYRSCYVSANLAEARVGAAAALAVEPASKAAHRVADRIAKAANDTDSQLRRAQWRVRSGTEMHELRPVS